MFLKNCWYVAAWSDELDQTGMLSRRLLGEQVLLYRRGDGTPAALVDRCSHRAAPLSIGRREGDAVRCMYHGLLFGADGRCVEIPGQERISPAAHVRAFPLVERDRFVWIWMGDPALADPAAIPDCHWQDDPAWRSLPATMHYKSDYRLIMDNQLDFSHLSFVHETTLGGSLTIAHTRPVIEPTQNGLRLTRWYLNEPELAPFLRGVAELEGPIDRWHIYDWFTGGNVLTLESGNAPAGRGAKEGRRDPRTLEFHAVQALTPETEHTSHFFWTYGHNFKLDDVDFTRALQARIQAGFDEDRAMIEAQQAALLAHPDTPMVDLAIDQGPLLARRLLARRLKAEAQS
jgi:phenylpropionate dioxygenase-like ring-hydroxylating dioxygenase large terminal subunit